MQVQVGACPVVASLTRCKGSRHAEQLHGQEPTLCTGSVPSARANTLLHVEDAGWRAQRGPMPTDGGDARTRGTRRRVLSSRPTASPVTLCVGILATVLQAWRGNSEMPYTYVMGRPPRQLADLEQASQGGQESKGEARGGLQGPGNTEAASAVGASGAGVPGGNVDGRISTATGGGDPVVEAAVAAATASLESSGGGSAAAVRARAMQQAAAAAARLRYGRFERVRQLQRVRQQRELEQLRAGQGGLELTPYVEVDVDDMWPLAPFMGGAGGGGRGGEGGGGGGEAEGGEVDVKDGSATSAVAAGVGGAGLAAWLGQRLGGSGASPTEQEAQEGDDGGSDSGPGDEGWGEEAEGADGAEAAQGKRDVAGGAEAGSGGGWGWGGFHWPWEASSGAGQHEMHGQHEGHGAERGGDGQEASEVHQQGGWLGLSWPSFGHAGGDGDGVGAADTGTGELHETHGAHVGGSGVSDGDESAAGGGGWFDFGGSTGGGDDGGDGGDGD